MDPLWRKKTADTYNRSAKDFADYFRGYSRVKCIEMVFELVGNPSNAKVLEIGCGDGRDAKEITKRTLQYIGFDISKELVEIAREFVPGADFYIADAVTYSYPANQELDIVFAFASLLHVDKTEMKDILTKLKTSLKAGGIVYLSLKYSSTYREEIKVDNHGERLFYLYNRSVIEELMGDSFMVVYCEENLKHGTSKIRGWRLPYAGCSIIPVRRLTSDENWHPERTAIIAFLDPALVDLGISFEQAHLLDQPRQ